MGSIKYGELDISKMYWGDAEVSKVYYGNTLIYEAGGTPPVPTTYTISSGSYNGTIGGDTTVNSGEDAVITLIPNSGYDLMTGSASTLSGWLPITLSISGTTENIVDNKPNTLITYDYANETITIPNVTADTAVRWCFFPYYQLKFNGPNSYFSKNTPITYSDITATLNVKGIYSANTLTNNTFTWSLSSTVETNKGTNNYGCLTITTTNYFYDLSDATVYGFNTKGKINNQTQTITTPTNNWISQDLKTLTLYISSLASISNPSVTIISHSTQPNFKNLTFVMQKLYSGQTWFIESDATDGSSISIITGGFTSNGTHFKGFGYTCQNGTDKSAPSATWNYIDDNNNQVKVYLTGGTGAGWVSDSYKTIKFDNTNYYNNDLWYWLISVMVGSYS